MTKCLDIKSHVSEHSWASNGLHFVKWRTCWSEWFASTSKCGVIFLCWWQPHLYAAQCSVWLLVWLVSIFQLHHSFQCNEFQEQKKVLPGQNCRVLYFPLEHAPVAFALCDENALVFHDYKVPCHCGHLVFLLLVHCFNTIGTEASSLGCDPWSGVSGMARVPCHATLGATQAPLPRRVPWRWHAGRCEK